MNTHHINDHPLENVAYGFLSRADGVSSSIYQGLNCGPGSSDNPFHVKENREIAAKLISGSSNTPLVSCYQVHGNNVCVVNKDWGEDRPKADGMVTNTSGILLGILTADCTPVLFADQTAGVIGAAHAGWKGALGGVLGNTIAAMEAMGATRHNITAMIGPTIHQKSYEVSASFRKNFLSQDPIFNQFFTTGRDADHCQFDLPGFVEHRLLTSGVTATNVDVDTYASEAHFSYRRTTHRGEPDYGRQISAIMLKP